MAVLDRFYCTSKSVISQPYQLEVRCLKVSKIVILNTIQLLDHFLALAEKHPYDISNCKTIILHVGSNDAENGMDLD